MSVGDLGHCPQPEIRLRGVIKRPGVFSPRNKSFLCNRLCNQYDSAPLKAFHAVVKHGGFARAAESTHLNQLAISLRIKELEK
ncbi:MAG: helix-turn-helix domain-containing protein [Candidatus Binatia bacterium]